MATKRLFLRIIMLLLAVVLSCVAFTSMFKPHWYLKVPKIGFLFYAILGGGSIPPYVNSVMWENDHLWAEPGDVIVAVPAKSGTTWTFQTVHQIRTHGVENYTNLLAEVPWIDFVYYPGQTIADRGKLLKKSKKNYGFKVFKTHMAPPTIKMRPDHRYVVVVRNVFDAVASFRPFLASHSPKFPILWGGFPDPRQTDEEYKHWILKDIGNGKSRALDDFFLDVIVGWWPYRKHPNVLLLHYHDRITNPDKDIDDLAKFLGVKLTATEKANVKLHSSFTWMKEHENIYSYGLKSLTYEVGPYQGSDELPEFIVSEGAMINKGPDRVATQVMNEEFFQEIENISIKRLGPTVFKWVQNGGPVPDVELGE